MSKFSFRQNIDINQLREVLLVRDSYSNEIFPYDSEKICLGSIIEKRSIRSRGFLNRYENVYINQYDTPFNCFEVVCKTKNILNDGFTYKRHLIDNKHFDKVIDYLVRNKKWGKEDFHIPPGDICIAHKREGYNTEIEYGADEDVYNTEVVKDFDASGSLTIKLFQYFEEEPGSASKYYYYYDDDSKRSMIGSTLRWATNRKDEILTLSFDINKNPIGIAYNGDGYIYDYESPKQCVNYKIMNNNENIESVKESPDYKKNLNMAQIIFKELFITK